MRPLFATFLATVLTLAVTKPHSAFGNAEETLRFRHIKPATVHFLDRRLAEDYAARLRSVGCTASLSWHWGHTDLAYQCTEWHELRCGSHQEVMDWMRFFSVLCFEAAHLH